MTGKSISYKSHQESGYSGYKSLDLNNKIYQIKAYNLAKKLLRAKQTVLEVGCADGSFIKLISKNIGIKPYGIDISPVSIRLAKKDGVIAKVHDLSNPLPYKNSSFNMVIGLEVIEHLFDTDFFLSECGRVLKAKCYLVLSTPNLASLNNRVRLFLGKYPRFLDYSAKGSHIHLYTPQVLVRQLEENGFELLNLSSPNFFNPVVTKNWCPSWLRKTSMFLGDVFPYIGSHIIILAQKNHK